MNQTNRYHFQGQHENEVIIRVVHRHWFNIFSHLVLVFILCLLLIGSLVVFPTLFPDVFDTKTTPLFLFIQNTFFLFLWLFSFLIWIDYYFDVWIITNERIVNIEQKGLFSRHVSELHCSRIQDVTSTVSGMIPTLLNFGDVSVQTAGEEEHFLFRQVGDPYAVKDLVMQLSRGTSPASTETAPVVRK